MLGLGLEEGRLEEYSCNIEVTHPGQDGHGAHQEGLL